MLVLETMSTRARGAIGAMAVVSVSLALGCSLESSGSASDDPFADAGVDTNPIFGGDSSNVDAGADTRPIIEGGSDTTPPPDTTPSPDTTPTPDTTPLPDTLDTAPETPLCDVTACASPPSGAKRMALVDRATACPSGFKSSDVVETKSGDACTCSCGMTSPTCPGNGDIATSYSSDASCGTTGATLHSSGSGACNSLGGGGSFGGSHFGATALGPTGGSCSAKPAKDVAAITKPMRLCELQTGCMGDVCGAPFDECVETSGACPSGYGAPHQIGASLDVTCPACDCTLASGTCSGTIDFFSNGSCGGTKTTFAVDGSCPSVPGGTGTLWSFKYTPNPVSGASCGPSFTSDPGTPSLGGTRTLCCRT